MSPRGKRIVVSAILAMGFGLLSVQGASPGSFTFTTFDVPLANSAGTDTEAQGIDDPGRIVGGYAGTDGRGHGFLDISGNFTAIDAFDFVLGALGTFARRINNVGQIVGWYHDGNGREHGFLLSKLAFTTIDVPPTFGAINTRAIGINDRGQIVGRYCTGGPLSGCDITRDNGFFRDTAGSFSTINVPDAIGTRPTGINDRGQISGFYRNATDGHGFLLTEGTFITIDVPFPGACCTSIGGLNNRGEFVGDYNIGSVQHAFLFTGTTFITIDPPGATYSEGDSVNDMGQVVGTYKDASGRFHAYVATP